MNKRNQEITQKYLEFINQHVEDVALGKVDEFMELNQIASALFVSHSHLSDVVQIETGHHPCYFYDEKIIEKAKSLLRDTNLTIAKIAGMLTYDPSNFSKFFKKMTGKTPLNYRLELKHTLK